MFKRIVGWAVNKFGVETVAYAIMFGFFFTAGALFISANTLVIKMTERDATFVVNSTEVDPKSSTYLINITYVEGTSDNPTLGATEVVQVADRWLIGQFNSYDDYFELKNTAGSGKVWRGTIGGWRVPLFSWTPEITSQQLTNQAISNEVSND